MPKNKKGLVIVNTGNGKGKSTAAFGVVLRAWGRGFRTCVIQFIKAETGKWGEVKAAQKLGIEWLSTGDGFTWLSKDIKQDKALARRCWALAKEKLYSGEYDVVILDELTYTLTYGWLPTDEVLETLRGRPDGVHVVITGRGAPQELIEFADLVTEMREVKHPYKQGVKAQPGIEF